MPSNAIPPPPVDAGIEIKVSGNKLAATVMLTPPLNGGADVTVAKIRDALAAAGVVYGIRNDVVERLGHSPRYKKAELIAEALAPVSGSDGYVEYHFATSVEFRPTIREDGSADFKKLFEIQNVHEGETLSTLHLPTEGTPGTDIIGGEIPPKPGKPAKLLHGAGTRLSEDGLSVLAAVDGQAGLVQNKVVVNNLYTVQRDVDVSTGNIDFVGNVFVMGNVKQGFTVRAEGNIEIRGTVDGGTLLAGGNVVIGQGYVGAKDSKIECGGDFISKYINLGEVNCNGNIATELIIRSSVRCAGTVRAHGKATIMGGSVIARYAIDCMDVGSKSNDIATTLEVGNAPHIVERSEALPAELSGVMDTLKRVDRLVLLFSQLKQQGRLPQDREVELERLYLSQSVLREKQVELNMELLDIEQRMMTVGYGVINIRGTANAGTRIVIGSDKKKLTDAQQFVQFTRTDQGIITGPAQPDY